MVRTVSCERRTASAILRGSDATIVMPAAEMAMSLPPPMAMPRSASASAALSLMPSPAIAVWCPAARSACRYSAFCCGSIEARKVVMPVMRATRCAAAALSPVSITDSMPIERSASTASRAPSRMRSVTPAMARTPPLSRVPSSVMSLTANHTTLLPSASRREASASASGVISIPLSMTMARLPAIYRLPPTRAVMPRPTIFSNAAADIAAAAVTLWPSASRWCTMACANGWSESRSMASSIWAAACPLPNHIVSVTSGRPSVRVPVLSKMTVSMVRAVSMLSASLIRMPRSAARPMPTIMAVGVARPKAQGQAMMRTVTMARIPCERPSTGANMIHARKEMKAMAMITGTNTEAMRSAKRCTGGLLP